MGHLGRKPNLARREQAAALRKQGLTLEEIGKRMGGITRQAVHQLLRGRSGGNGRKK
jgi:transcriptional regulator with XRE-family HTH domain